MTKIYIYILVICPVCSSGLIVVNPYIGILEALDVIFKIVKFSFDLFKYCTFRLRNL